MNEHASPQEVDEDNILKAALSTAFHSPRNSIHQSRRRSNIPNIPTEADISIVEPVPAEQQSTSQSTDDSWKAEYEAQVESWRAQSAEAREKAEKERARWEAIRAAEKANDADRQTVMAGVEAQVHDSDAWETVGAKKTSDFSSSQQSTHYSSEFRSAADAGDLVFGDPQTPHRAQATPQAKPDLSVPSTYSGQDPTDDNNISSFQKWEDLHSSQTSSFPSMSFPDNLETPSPERQATSKSTPSPAVAPFSATLAIFDSTLPTRTRVSALFSSLAINMLLPFVNGVMLGFGEIFAKNIAIGWFGWKLPGAGVTNVGVGIRPLPERRRRT